MKKLIMNTMMKNNEVKSATVLDLNDINSIEIATALLFKTYLEYHANGRILDSIFPKEMSEEQIFKKKALICLALMEVFDEGVLPNEISEYLEDSVFNDMLYDFYDEEIKEDEVLEVGFELITEDDIKEVQLEFLFNNEKECFEINIK